MQNKKKEKMVLPVGCSDVGTSDVFQHRAVEALVKLVDFVELFALRWPGARVVRLGGFVRRLCQATDGAVRHTVRAEARWPHPVGVGHLFSPRRAVRRALAVRQALPVRRVPPV